MDGKQLCEKLKIDSKTLARWLKEGLPSHGPGRQRRFDPDAVAAWLVATGRAEAKGPTGSAAKSDSPSGEKFVLRTRDDVARHFGVSLRTVATWIREGMPGRPGSPGKQEGHFPVDRIVAWLEGRDNKASYSGDEQRAVYQARLAKARAELIELELAEKTGRLIPAEEIARRLSRFIFEAKAQLDQLPTRLIALLPPKAPAKLRARFRARAQRTLAAAYTALELLLERQAEEIEAAERELLQEPRPERGEKTEETPN